MSANFKKGQVLTAAHLNEAINGVLSRGGSSPQAVGGQVRQNRLPVPVLSPDVPVYLDQSSMILPAGAEDGWYIQADGELQRLESVETGTDVYLVIYTDFVGQEQERKWTSSPPPAEMWNLEKQIPGVIVRKMGRTAENPFMKAGAGSDRFLYYPLDKNRVELEFLNYASEELPDDVVEFPLLSPQAGSTRPVRVIQSGGGLLEVPPATNTDWANPLALAPRVSLFSLNDDTCAPGTGYTESACTLRMGEWVPLARFSIGEESVWLNGYWVTPWRVGLSFAPSVVNVGGLPEKMAWQGDTPILGVDVHGLGPWKRVSYTPGVLMAKDLTKGDLTCNYEIYDYAVYEAPGTYAPETIPPESDESIPPGSDESVPPGSDESVPPETGESNSIRRVLWVAFMRRRRWPQRGEWEQFDTTELTEYAPV